jgi:hypothetical protein
MLISVDFVLWHKSPPIVALLSCSSQPPGILDFMLISVGFMPWQNSPSCELWGAAAHDVTASGWEVAKMTNQIALGNIPCLKKPRQKPRSSQLAMQKPQRSKFILPFRRYSANDAMFCSFLSTHPGHRHEL